jgi:hydrogenase maturation protein HypF
MTGIQRIHIAVRGAVQGVGFRPFVYRLAAELHLTGWVLNSSQGVFAEVEGEAAALEQFLLRLEQEKPPHAFIQSLEYSFLDPVGYFSFEIRASSAEGERSALVLPDIATCPECLADISDPSNRRYRYPFTNCTNCGPRFSIIHSLPYDRPNTAMREFTMCEECRQEYEDPSNRRFHAQPNACPVCGPHMELWDAAGNPLALRSDAVEQAASALRDGLIVAVKGLGGFHLMVDARNQEAVLRLRRRKQREEKPLALMLPRLDLARNLCDVSPLEERLLRSPEAPIVLLPRKHTRGTEPPPQMVAEAVSPENPYLGIMLPYTPLHHILTAATDFPLVATSGNMTDEPICTDEREAVERLRGIADLFLVHNRPIVRYVDDSVVRVMMGRELVLRRARGYAPLPISLSSRMADAIAVGAHLKNTIAAILTPRSPWRASVKPWWISNPCLTCILPAWLRTFTRITCPPGKRRQQAYRSTMCSTIMPISLLVWRRTISMVPCSASPGTAPAWVPTGQSGEENSSDPQQRPIIEWHR